MTESEERRLRPYTGGAPDSFDDFYRREYRPLLRLAWSLTGRLDLGEEMVQETMLRVHRRWARVSAYESPGGFARRVMLNDLVSAARRRTAERRAMQRLRPVDHGRLDDPPPDETLWSALRGLPTRQAQVLALHYVEDRSVDQIAKVLDIAANTVKVHLHRGRHALAEALTHEGER